MAVSLKKLSSKKIYLNCLKNFLKSFKLFLCETGLHGLKFVGASYLTVWERAFFFCAFIGAFVTTCHLISNIYAKWVSTPVIIGISPHVTSIMKVPFPAITVCNMNQALRSKVSGYAEESYEQAILKLLCNDESEISEEMQESPIFNQNELQIADFVTNHSQPCDRLMLRCKFSTVAYNCSDLFREVKTDEGLCCVFNRLSDEFLYNIDAQHCADRENDSQRIFKAVDWKLETGYPEELPKNYSPLTAAGTGVSMGFSIVIDAQLDEYYCSSTNGPGFKILFHNPIETPNMKEAGLIVPIGYETRFRIEVVRSEAVANIRSIGRKDRKCLFNDEMSLAIYKHYTLRNCERECEARLVFETCNCIPYNLPRVVQNATVCSVKDRICESAAKRLRQRPEKFKCFTECLPTCFDLTYLSDVFSTPLASKNFLISDPFLRSFNKTYLRENIAVVHFYYRESVYNGNLKNVYVGFTEFLSNVGGVMGLFLGFSFISLAEIFYFLLLKPIMDLIPSQHVTEKPLDKDGIASKDVNKIWYTRELYPKGIKSRSDNVKMESNSDLQLIEM